MDSSVFERNTGVKGQNQALNTAKYQVYRGVKGSAKLMLIAGQALFQQVIDVIKSIFGK